MKLLDLRESFRKVIENYTIKHKVYGVGSNYLYGDNYNNENEQLIRILHKLIPHLDNKEDQEGSDASVSVLSCLSL